MTGDAAAAGDRLVFVPLGGAGEIGMNLNLYGLGPAEKERWLMVDLGIAFGDPSTPGVDVIMADPTFIAERRDRLDGLLLTHAHEDHLGAVPYLWPRFGCPVYGTGFALSVLRRKLEEAGLGGQVPLISVPMGARFAIGPFDLELITMTHSTPEPNAVAIRTPAGLVLHTGDWKFDADPVVGPASDEEALARLGDEGVLALVCDSTNALEDGTSGSEGDLLESLTEFIKDCSGRVAVTCFASNVARLRTIAAAAAATGRTVVCAGRSLKRVEAAARENGYLKGVPPFADESMAGYIPNDRLLVICTGSQGEPRAALARIAWGSHPRVSLDAGDTVIFSARQIPGNEMAIGRLQDALIRRGVRLITDRDGFVHVSGHPARDELAHMYRLSRPRHCVPVHGELRHMEAQAALARSCQVPSAVVVENGDVLRLERDEAVIEGTVESGRLALEGRRLVAMDGSLVRGRTRAIYNGVAVVTVVVDSEGNLADRPVITSVGLLDDNDPLAERLTEVVGKAIDGLSRPAYNDDETVRDAVRIAVRRLFREVVGKKPITEVHLIRA